MQKLNRQNLRILEKLSKKQDYRKGDHHSYQLGPSWHFKFKDFSGDHFYHLEELRIEENNPVEQHNKLISQFRSSDEEEGVHRPSIYEASDMAQHQ